MSELTAAHSTIEKAREVTNCPDGVELQEHLKQLVSRCDALTAENAGLKGALNKIAFTYPLSPHIHEMTTIKTPATDSILRAAEARARIEGINYAASRLAAAYNQGFIDKPLSEVFDVVRMILTAKEDLANTPAEDGLSGEYAKQALKDWEAELREGKT